MTLSARAAVVDAYRWLFKGVSAFVALAWGPAIVSAVLYAVLVVAADAIDAPALIKLSSLSTLVFGSLFAVAWHRRVLTGEERPRPTWGRALRYVALLAGIGGSIALMIIPVSLLAFVVGLQGLAVDWAVAILMVASSFYFTTRVMTLLPAVALGAKHQLRDAWNATRGRGVRLCLGIWFGILPFVVLDYLIGVSASVWIESKRAAVLTAGFASIFVFFVETALWTGYASSIFRQSGALDAAATAPSS